MKMLNEEHIAVVLTALLLLDFDINAHFNLFLKQCAILHWNLHKN